MEEQLDKTRFAARGVPPLVFGYCPEGDARPGHRYSLLRCAFLSSSVSCSPMSPSKRQGAFFGLAAALLFGISPPFAKLLLPESGPMLIAGLLYLGAGFGLLLFEMTGRPFQLGVQEASVRRADVGLLAGGHAHRGDARSLSDVGGTGAPVRRADLIALEPGSALHRAGCRAGLSRAFGPT